MTAQTVIEDDHHHQRQWSGVVPVAGAGRGVEHLVAQTVVTAAGFARAMCSESVPVANLEVPLATGEPEQGGGRAAESGGGRRVRASGLRVPGPPFPPVTTPARQRLSGSGPLAARGGGGGLDSHRRAGESGAGPLRWGRCPDDGRLHLLQSAAVAATTTGHAQTLCGRQWLVTIEITDRGADVARRVSDDAVAQGTGAGGSSLAVGGAEVLLACRGASPRPRCLACVWGV